MWEPGDGGNAISAEVWSSFAVEDSNNEGLKWLRTAGINDGFGQLWLISIGIGCQLSTWLRMVHIG